MKQSKVIKTNKHQIILLNNQNNQVVDDLLAEISKIQDKKESLFNSIADVKQCLHAIKQIKDKKFLLVFDEHQQNPEIYTLNQIPMLLDKLADDEPAQAKLKDLVPPAKGHQIYSQTDAINCLKRFDAKIHDYAEFQGIVEVKQLFDNFISEVNEFCRNCEADLSWASDTFEANHLLYIGELPQWLLAKNDKQLLYKVLTQLTNEQGITWHLVDDKAGLIDFSSPNDIMKNTMDNRIPIMKKIIAELIEKIKKMD